MASTSLATPRRPMPGPVPSGPTRKKTPSPTKRPAPHSWGTPSRPSKSSRASVLMSDVSPLPLPLAVPARSSLITTHPLEIPLDDGTDLLRHLTLSSTHERKLHAAIAARYTGVLEVVWAPPFVVVRFQQLPARPWPLKIGGLLAWFTDKRVPEEGCSPNHLLMPGQGGGGRGECGRDLVVDDCELVPWEMPAKSMLEAVYHAMSGLGLHVRAVTWSPYQIVIETPDDLSHQQRMKLPMRIASHVASHAVYYTNESALGVESAARLKFPTDVDPDNEEYRQLRPGVMLGGRINGQDLLTTSGVCIQSSNGDRYVTGAAHGFSREVWHPTPQGRKIGQIVQTWPASDISLIQLQAGVEYAGTTFADEGEVMQPFTRLVNPKGRMQRGDFVHMNTPFNGLCSGIWHAVQISPLPADDPNSTHSFSEGYFVYFGQRSTRILDGCCGAAIYNDEHEVVGQFRFLSKEGDTAYFPTFEPLLQEGFTLSEITLTSNAEIGTTE